MQLIEVKGVLYNLDNLVWLKPEAGGLLTLQFVGTTICLDSVESAGFRAAFLDVGYRCLTPPAKVVGDSDAGRESKAGEDERQAVGSDEDDPGRDPDDERYWPESTRI